MMWNAIINLANEVWTSLLRMGSPRVTPNAIEAPARPTRQGAGVAPAPCAASCFSAYCAPCCA